MNMSVLSMINPSTGRNRVWTKGVPTLTLCFGKCLSVKLVTRRGRGGGKSVPGSKNGIKGENMVAL